MSAFRIVKIPVICMGAETRKLYATLESPIKVVGCRFLNVDEEHLKEYIAANEAPIPNVYQRTLYKKGPETSEKIGCLFVDLQTGVYTLKLNDPLARPAGVDIHLTIQETPKESQ
jgi:hypothetical protein